MNSTKKTPRTFNGTESNIMRVMRQVKVSMTIYEIAGKAHITHPTAKKYVKELFKDGLLYKVIQDNGDVGYIFNYELFKKLKQGNTEQGTQ